MEEAKNAANGGDAVKKKSFLKKILISKWFIIIVLILGVSGYATWWGMNWWKDFTAKRGGQTHEPQVVQKTDAPHDSHSTAKDAMHDALTTHQPAAQKQKPYVPSQHANKSQKDTAPQTFFNETADENKAAGHEPAETGTMHAAPVRTGPRGVAFVEACIKPLDNELNHRFWGWRPNDIIKFTDNINNLQLGVLEVTRRTAVALAENLSRTGRADAYVPSLEYAMNSFMIKPSEYMFPSAESKYQEGLDEWLNYQKMLERGEAQFYRRLDNLVPLLKAYESILGSCDENLVKELGQISSFKADDIFYYTKGVATAMSTILEAVAIDFDDTIRSVQGMDLLHHTIEALHHAAHMDPWIVLEGSPDGILANHRANIAASISHARFYLDVLSRSLTGNL
ncbi:MAG: DUF2333 family protein [Thermodesulfobacteriota bacterium]